MLQGRERERETMGSEVTSKDNGSIRQMFELKKFKRTLSGSNFVRSSDKRGTDETQVQKLGQRIKKVHTLYIPMTFQSLRTTP